MSDVEVFLFICCLICSGIFAFSCTKSYLSVCRLKKGFSASGYFTVSVLFHMAATAAEILWFDCRYFALMLLAVNFLLSLIFTDGLVRMRYYTAGIHVFLLTAARTIIIALLRIVTNRSVPAFSSGLEGNAAVLPICVLCAAFLMTCLFERIARNACTVNGARAPEFTPKMLTYLCISVTLFLLFTLTEAAVTGEGAKSVRMYAVTHLILCLLLYGGIWLLARYHATMTHIAQTKKDDSRQREEKYYNYYSAQAQTLEEMRRFRHDYKNQLAGLKALIDSGEFERASEYLSGIATRFDGMRQNTVSYSDNTLADAVLQNLAKRCEGADIAFSGSLVIGKEIPLADPELCTVLSNLADNAFEAAQRVPEGERFISFTGSRRVKWLTITAENSYDGVLFTDRNGIVTRKSDHVMHGLGLKSVRTIVESVPGASVRIEPSPEEKVFRISLIFPRTPVGSGEQTAAVSRV